MNDKARWVFGVCVVVSLLFVAMALHLWGAAEIRADSSEVIFLTFACALWLVVMAKLFPWFGLSLRDDAVERKNDRGVGRALWRDCRSGVALCGREHRRRAVLHEQRVFRGPCCRQDFSRYGCCWKLAGTFRFPSPKNATRLRAFDWRDFC